MLPAITNFFPEPLIVPFASNEESSSSRCCISCDSIHRKNPLLKRHSNKGNIYIALWRKGLFIYSLIIAKRKIQRFSSKFHQLCQVIIFKNRDTRKIRQERRYTLPTKSY